MNLFLQACGADRPMLLNINGKDVSFPRPFLVIGRDPRSDVILNHPEVSRRHVYIQMIDGHVFCCNLRNRGGLQWDGGGSSYTGWLDHDRGLRIGPYSIRLSAASRADHSGDERPEGRPSPLKTNFPDPPILMETTLESPAGVVRQNGITVHRIGRVLNMMGRSPACEPYLHDPSVSWLHCGLVRTPLGTWVVDLVGRGGIAVNGVSVRSARLADGDEIGVGYHLVRVQIQNQGRVSERREGPRERTKAIALGSGGPSEPDGRGPTGSGLNPPHWPAVLAQNPMASRSLAPTSRPSPLSPFVESGTALAEQGPADLMLTNAAMMAVMNQFGLQQRQMLEQFFQTMMTMFQVSNSMHREEQDSIRRELDQLCKLTEEMAEVRAEMATLRSSPTGLATPDASPAAVSAPRSHGKIHPPDGPALTAPQGDFYDWLSSRMETLQSEQQSRWQCLMSQLLGRRHGGATP